MYGESWVSVHDDEEDGFTSRGLRGPRVERGHVGDTGLNIPTRRQLPGR